MQIPEPLIPKLRGVSHLVAFVIAIVATFVLLVLTSSARATIAAITYGAGLIGLFGCSALYHRWKGSPRVKLVLRRIDHSTIFVFIAASYTPVTLVLMHGPMAWIVLVLAWLGAAAGVALSLGWITAPRVAFATSYVALGWVALLALPQLVALLSPTPLLLLVGGGVLYTVGAVVYAKRWPDPWPRIFGFHEVFHALVIAAATAQYVAIAGWVLPAAHA